MIKSSIRARAFKVDEASGVEYNMLKSIVFSASAASVFALALAACGDGGAGDPEAGMTPPADAAAPARQDAINTLPGPGEAADAGPDAAGPSPTGPASAAALAPVEDFGEPRGRADFEFAGGVQGSGTAWFFEAGEGVRVHVRVRGMTPGAHAIHVHETGDCSAPDFTSAGEHLGVEAGSQLPDKPDDFEAGMLPDIAAVDDGSGELNAVLEVVSFTEDTERTWPLFDADGAAIVIHRFATGDVPAGEDNPRIACAEIYESDL